MDKLIDWFRQRFQKDSAIHFFFTNKTPERCNRIIYYCGSLAVIFLILQIITGSLLSLYYRPSADDAYASILYINSNVEFGAFIRSIHYWTSHALIISLIFWLLSKFFLRAYRKPGEPLWFLSLSIFLIILLFAFTGQTLPWTDLSYFGTVIGISQIEKIPVAGHFITAILKGSNYVSGETLSRIYSFHTILLPVCLIFLLLFYLKMKNSLKQPAYSKEKETFVLQKGFIYKITIIMISGLIVIAAISIFIPKGLGPAYDINNPTGAPAGIHPEWYFIWIYQTLKADSFLPGSVLSIFFLLIALFWFAIPFLGNKISSGKKKLIFYIAVISIIYIFVLTIWGYLSTGFSSFETASAGNIATGGIDKVSFLGIILFTLGIFIILLYLRIKSHEKAHSSP